MTREENELNEKWAIHKVIQEAMKTSHIQSSPETLRLFDEMKINHENSHKEILLKIQELSDKIEPVLKLQATAQGFAQVTLWISKYIAMPAIIILGAILTWKEVFKK